MNTATTTPDQRSLGDRLGYRYRLARWELRTRVRRLRNAAAYASGRLSEDQASQIIHDCQSVAGWWPLATFSTDGVLEQALDLYEDHPALPHLVREACEHVARKWAGDSGEIAGAAEDWALDLIERYARDDGVDLKPREE